MTQKETWTCVTRYSALPLPCSLPHRLPSQYRSVGTVNTAGSGLNQHTILRQSLPGHRRPIVDVEDKVPDVHTLGCIKRPTFQKMFSIASVTRIYLLHILKPSTIPILKCIWGHLGGPHPPWSSQNFLNLHHYAQNFKIVVQRSSYAHSKALDETKIL